MVPKLVDPPFPPLPSPPLPSPPLTAYTQRFVEADADGGGSLDPEEIMPLLRAMLPDSLKKHLTIEHSERLVDIFDDDGGEA